MRRRVGVVTCGCAVAGGVVTGGRVTLGRVVAVGCVFAGRRRVPVVGAVVVAGCALVVGGGAADVGVVGAGGAAVGSGTTAVGSSVTGVEAPEFEWAAAVDHTPVRAMPPSSPAAVIWLTRRRRRSRVLAR